MDENLKSAIQRLLNSQDIEDQRVGLNILLNDEVAVEDRFAFTEQFMKNSNPELSEDIHRVYDTLYAIIREKRIKGL